MMDACDVCALCVAPAVEYRDWAELVSLAYQTQHKYLEALFWSLDEEIENNSILRSRLCLWSRAVPRAEQYLSDLTVQGPVQSSVQGPVQGPESSRFVPALTNTSLKSLRDTGSEILQVMTKGNGVEWCTRINNFMWKYLLRVVHMHCNSITLHSTFTNTAEVSVGHRPYLFELMREEVSYLFSGGLPMCLCSDQGFIALILTRNFCILTRRDWSMQRLQRQMRMHPEQDLWSPDCSPSVVVLSHAQFRDMLLTLAMGTHARLGRESVLECLLPDLLRLICRNLLLQGHFCAQLFHQEEMWLF